MIDKIFNRVARIIRGRLVFAYLFMAIGLLLSQVPNPVTHECLPDARTALGLSHDGYPEYARHFCKEGYYPELKWGLGDTLDSTIANLFIILPLAIIVMLLGYILVKRKFPWEPFMALLGVKIPKSPDDTYSMKVISETDTKIANAKKKEKRPNSINTS